MFSVEKRHQTSGTSKEKERQNIAICKLLVMASWLQEIKQPSSSLQSSHLATATLLLALWEITQEIQWRPLEGEAV